MDLYEGLTQVYLTAIEGLFVLPQCPIRHSVEGKLWTAYPDFVALDFADRRIQIIEVTKRSAREAARLADKLGLPHRVNVEHYIRTTTLANCLDFPFRWRFFVRNAAAIEAVTQTEAYREYVDGGGEARVETLETVFSKIGKLLP